MPANFALINDKSECPKDSDILKFLKRHISEYAHIRESKQYTLEELIKAITEY
jgi:hypothetical protein